MNQKQIEQMFDGRWSIKSQHIEEELETLLINPRVEYVKGLCRDFFEAGVLLAGEVIKDGDFITTEITFEDGSKGSVTYMHDPIIDSDDEGFGYWWNLYDLKCGRGTCEKKWAKLTPNEKRKCIEATPAYVVSTPDKQYRKRPITYLNQKAWNDEIIIRNSKDQQRSQRIAEAANLVAKYTGADKGTKG